MVVIVQSAVAGRSLGAHVAPEASWLMDLGRRVWSSLASNVTESFARLMISTRSARAPRRPSLNFGMCAAPRLQLAPLARRPASERATASLAAR